MILWGTYKIVWNELDGRFTEKQQGIWWFGGKCAIFLVCMVSLFYTILYLALSIVWMEFVSLNTIADVATKRTQFEISMAALFFGFSLLTVGTATVAIVWGSSKIDGRIRKVRFMFQILLGYANGISRHASSFLSAPFCYSPGLSRSLLSPLKPTERNTRDKICSWPKTSRTDF